MGDLHLVDYYRFCGTVLFRHGDIVASSPPSPRPSIPRYNIVSGFFLLPTELTLNVWFTVHAMHHPVLYHTMTILPFTDYVAERLLSHFLVHKPGSC
jgi:hypothetical protein